MGKFNSTTVVIASLEDVQGLHSSPTRLWNLEGPIEVCIPELSQLECERIQSRASELIGVCGCAEGAAAGAIALIAVIVFWILRELTFALQTLFTAGAVVIGIVLFTKFMRVIFARMLLQRLFGNLLAALHKRIPTNQQRVMP